MKRLIGKYRIYVWFSTSSSIMMNNKDEHVNVCLAIVKITFLGVKYQLSPKVSLCPYLPPPPQMKCLVKATEGQDTKSNSTRYCNLDMQCHFVLK